MKKNSNKEVGTKNPKLKDEELAHATAAQAVLLEAQAKDLDRQGKHSYAEETRKKARGFRNMAEELAGHESQADTAEYYRGATHK